MMKKNFKNSCFYVFLALSVIGLPQCAKETKKEDMTAKELSDRASKAIAKKKGDEAVSYLEELIGRFPDHDNIAEYKMKLAEQYFKDGKYPAAQEVYEHFNQFYPADKQSEYAKYKSILSMFNQTLRPDCDQSETEDAIKLCEEYLKNDAYNKYRGEIVRIQGTCENKLVDKEIYVFDFYLKRKNYSAAHSRLKHLKEKYANNNQVLNARILYLECKLAQREKNMPIVNKKIDQLVAQYPKSEFTQMAQALVAKSVFIF